MSVTTHWYAADNHKYLLVYWAFTIFMGLHLPDFSAFLGNAARYLIAGTMGWAVYHKVVSPDYINLDFFQHGLLFDGRFEGVVMKLGLLEPSALDANRMAIKELTHWSDIVSNVGIRTNNSVREMSRWLTWGGLALEMLVVLTFLLPQHSRFGRLRDLPLLAFIVFVYPIATVLGFAYTLVAMGSAQARSGWATLSYASILVLLQLYALPWSRLS